LRIRLPGGETVEMNNYWESSQRRFWTFTKQQLAAERKRMEEAEKNLVNLFPLPDRRHLSIYFYSRAYS
jgi:cyclin C